MESNIEILNNIMKPYFDKKTQIEGVPGALQQEEEELKSKVKELKSERIEKRRELEKRLEELETRIIEIKTERIEKRKTLKIELENLRVRNKISINDFNERKEIEIEEYIAKAMNSNPNLSAAYGSFVRKDLEKQYEEQLKNMEISFKESEEELLKKIKELGIENDLENTLKEEQEQLLKEIKELRVVSADERLEKQNIENLSNKPNFSRVDLRELVETKDEIRKQLFAERKRLSLELAELKPSEELYLKISSELKENQIRFSQIMDQLTNFKYEYNDQNQVVNRDKWKELYEESNLISGKIQELTTILMEKESIIHELNDISKSLEKVEEYIKLTELTKEEISAVMMSMTPWEREEYNKRKGITKPEYKQDDVVEFDDPIVSKYQTIDDSIVVEDKANLLKTIYNDIVREVKKLRSVKLNPSKDKLGENEYYISTKDDSESYKLNGIVDLSNDGETLELPCGEYINSSDINEAIDSLYAKNKGRSYIVKESDKKFKISRLTIEKFKFKLKNCSTIKLIRDKKISKLDLFRVFGKEKSEKIVEETEIGQLQSSKNLEGDYVSRNELIVTLDNLFSTKKIEWLKNISEKFKLAKKEESETIEIDEDFHIKNR